MTPRLCGRCRNRPVRAVGQRYCAACHNEANRNSKARERAKAQEYFAAVNGEKKAQRMVSWLWNLLTPENRIDPETVNVLRRLDHNGWRLLAQEANEDVPSEVTRLRIIELVTQRVRDARWGFDHGRSVA